MFFGEFLVNNKKVTTDQLNEALARQKELDKPIGEALVILGYLDAGELDDLLQEFMLNSAEIIFQDPEYQSIV